MSHAEYVGLVRQQIVALADGALTGELSCLEAAVAICQLASEGDVAAHDRDFEVISFISSEIDALPVGRVRALWSEETLIQLQPEVERAEAWARPMALPAYRRVVARFHA